MDVHRLQLWLAIWIMWHLKNLKLNPAVILRIPMGQDRIEVMRSYAESKS